MEKEIKEESKEAGSAHTQIGEKAPHEPPYRDGRLVLERRASLIMDVNKRDPHGSGVLTAVG